MAVEDFFDAEVGIAVAVTALATSPQVRNAVRRGLVFGLAGLLRAGDTLGSAAQGMAQSAQETTQLGASLARDTAAEAKAKR
jgi:hypothetical protein